MIRTYLALFLAVLLASSSVGLGLVSGDEAAEKLAAFEKEFHATAKQPRTEAQRIAAIGTLAGLDSPAVAEAVVSAWAECSAERAAVLEERESVERQISELLRGHEFGHRTLPTDVIQALNDLKGRSRELAAAADALQRVEAELGGAVSRLASAESVSWLLTRAVGDKKLPLALKLAAARNAGKAGESIAGVLAKLATKAKEPEDVCVVLTAARDCGKPARACAPAAVAWLAHADMGVRELAAAALARLGAPQSLEPLIERLSAERGRMRGRIADALETLTGMKLGESVEAWKAWFANEGPRYLSGELELDAGASSLADALTTRKSKPKTKSLYGPTFYGIPQDGHSIVYVIDCSGSMVVSITNPKYEGGQPVSAGAESRMEATKAALIEVLGKLDARDRFNIVCFNDVVTPYSDKLIEAKPSDVKQAQEWVGELVAAQSTNIHDAMGAAFRFAGRGAKDKYYKSAVDTIFLLTDGTPTTNDGKVDSTDRILAAVRGWNPHKHVVVHTIGIGKDLNDAFLRKIAEENGGRYVQQ